jgi:predicted HTH transcriptional regulator
MFYMGLVKEHAQGTKKMRDRMREMLLPEPKFRQVESGVGFSQVVVTLYNHIKEEYERFEKLAKQLISIPKSEMIR